MTVWSRILANPDMCEVLERLDREYGHDAPLNGIVQYQMLISKTRTPDREREIISNAFFQLHCLFCARTMNHMKFWTPLQEVLLWCLRCIEMYFSSGFLVKGDLTTRQISAVGGNKGIIDLFMFKNDLLNHLLGAFLDEKVLADPTRKAVRMAFQDHASHRKLFGWPKDAEQPDLTWNASWLESERSVLLLIEACPLH